jgi:hypothetical protein
VGHSRASKWARPEYRTQTVNLAILGGDADVDNFVQRARSNVNDQRAIQTMLKAKDVARTWEQTVITGDAAVDANAFDGPKMSTRYSAGPE